jgi:hypothetical protein
MESLLESKNPQLQQVSSTCDADTKIIEAGNLQCRTLFIGIAAWSLHGFAPANIKFLRNLKYMLPKRPNDGGGYNLHEPFHLKHL